MGASVAGCRHGTAHTHSLWVQNKQTNTKRCKPQDPKTQEHSNNDIFFFIIIISD